MPVIDENPACPREERYKALAGIKREGGLFAYKSPDGIHWSLMQEEPVITNGAFDSATLASGTPPSAATVPTGEPSPAASPKRTIGNRLDTEPFEPPLPEISSTGTTTPI